MKIDYFFKKNELTSLISRCEDTHIEFKRIYDLNGFETILKVILDEEDETYERKCAQLTFELNYIKLDVLKDWLSCIEQFIAHTKVYDIISFNVKLSHPHTQIHGQVTFDYIKTNTQQLISETIDTLYESIKNRTDLILNLDLSINSGTEIYPFSCIKIDRINRANQYLQQDFASIEVLEIKHASFSPQHINKLIEKLTASNDSKNNPLNSISMIDCDLNDESLVPLAGYLKTFSSIEKIDLSDNDINQGGLSNLLESLQAHPLLYLRLAGNNIKDDDMTIFKKKLVMSAKFISLDLSTNYITNVGLAAIIDILNAPTNKIMHLNLANNEIDNDGLSQLAKCIENHKYLTLLDLRENKRITGSGLPGLATSLCQNKVLRRLYLPHDSMDRTSAISFINTIAPKKKNQKRNTALIDLYLKGWEAIPNKARITQTNKPSAWWVKFKQDNIIDKEEKNYLVDFIAASNNKFLETNKESAKILLAASEVKKLTELLSLASLYTCRDFTDTEDGASLLHLAVIHKNKSFIQYLLSIGFNKEIPNKAGLTALELAQEKNDFELVGLLTKSLASPLKGKPPLSAPEDDSSEDEQESVASEDQQPEIKRRRLIKSSSLDDNALSDEEESVASASSLTREEDLDDEEIAPSAIPLSPQLIALVADGQIYQLKMLLKAKHVLLTDNDGNTLLHFAAQTGQLASAELILALVKDTSLLINNTNKAKETPLHTVIKTLSTLPPQHNTQKYLDVAWLFIRKGANPSLTVADSGRKQLSALHLAVIHERYTLMKILLSSPLCDINLTDSNNFNVLDWAIKKRNIIILTRLLIDRRLTQKTLQATLDHYKEQPILNDKVLDEMLRMLEKRMAQTHPSSKPGIQWVKRFTVIFGSHYAKPKRSLTINSEKQHNYLMTQNQFNQHRIFNFKPEDSQTDIKDMDGNPVTASLVFLVSAQAHQAGAGIARQKIRIPLDFINAYHITKSEEEVTSKEEFERILHRASSVAEDIIEEKKEINKDLKDPHEISSLHNQETGENSSIFARLFRHGEQALLDYLEQPQTIVTIVNRLLQHPKFVAGCKVYGLILELHSPRYLCGNCEISILGEQNAEQSKFLQQLATLLQKRGCILPRYNSLRMLTQASSYIAFPDNRAKVEENEHEDMIIDFRSCHNNIIMACDLSAFANEDDHETELTQFHSSKTLC